MPSFASGVAARDQSRRASPLEDPLNCGASWPQALRASPLACFVRIIAQCDVKAPDRAANFEIGFCSNGQAVGVNHNVIESIDPDVLSILDCGFIRVVDHQEIIEGLRQPTHPVYRRPSCRSTPKWDPELTDVRGICDRFNVKPPIVDSVDRKTELV